MFSEAASSIVS